MKQTLFITGVLFIGLTSCNLNETDPANHLIKDSIDIKAEQRTEPPANSLVRDTSDNEPGKEEFVESVKSLADLRKHLNKKASYFVVKTNRDTVIKCKNGTLLSIPADAFLNASSQETIVGEVKISVKEFYKTSDMLIAGLTTSSNKKILETGGMIDIKVRTKEKKDSCILKPGKTISIAMPNSQLNNMRGMQLFNGSHDSSEINWVPRNGIPGLAQPWSRGRGYFLWNPSEAGTRTGFIFPDDLLKSKPQIINSNPRNLQTEFKITIRDLLQSYAVVTKKASGYIDTAGNLHCYKIAGQSQEISFPEIYKPCTYQNMKVNVAVDFKVSYKSNLNYEYYQKLLKMGKAKVDSVVEITVTLIPDVKLNDFATIYKTYNSAITVTQYRRRERQRVLAQREYEKRVTQLRLNEETRMANAEKNPTSGLAAAQDYLLLNTSKLGWINCDRFYESPDKVDFLVTLKEPASLLIVFNDIKSIIPSDKQGIFHGVPMNQKITIVGLKTEEGKLMMAFHETTITQQPFAALNFKPVTIKEYKDKLERLNSL